MKSKIALILLFCIALFLVIYTIFFMEKKADLLLINGIIYTLDDNNPLAEAIAIKEGYIIAVRNSSELKDLYNAEKIIDLKGSVVIPGLTDAHAHMFGFGQMLNSLMLAGITSENEIAGKVAEKSKTISAGEWIYGRGWDQTLWSEKKFPTKDLLDSAAPDNPVILGRIDGHAIWVNSKTLEMAGITSATIDPLGGKIIRDNSGKPTGVLIDKATELVEKMVPPPTDADVEQSILLAAEECLKAGLTEVHDMGLNSQTIRVYKKLADEQKLLIRIYGAIDAPSQTWNEFSERGPLLNYGNGMLTIRAVKMYADGALGSRGAALVENYSDDPGNRGLTLLDDSTMEAVTRQAIKKNFQVCTHAIGDRANHFVLNMYEKVLGTENKKDLRFRIEHAQVILPEDISRFSKLNVLPSMQPIHSTSDMDWAEARLNSGRVKGAYAWKSLIKSGSFIPAGSDFPNDIMQPLWGFYAAVTRMDQDGKPEGGWHAEECMSREEALKSYTTWAAYAAFKEKEKGTIEVGKCADLTIISQDIMTIPASEILNTDIVMTMIGGKVVYSR
ncbi:MAG: amidohydrolase [Bacteroidota bacterium]|nr:amidohydrolase [Bacteroidota bacterium]